MALRYIDSMGDHYTAAQAALKWTAASFQSRVAGLHGFGMRGNFTKGLAFGSPTTLIEAQINILSLGGSLARVADSNATTQWSAGTNQNGSIVVSRFGGPVIGQSAPDVLRTNTWYHLGIRVRVHATLGELEVRLNGGPVIGPLTGVNTTHVNGLWSGLIHSFSIGGNDNAIIFDDLVVMDDVDDGLDDPRLPGGGGFDKFLGQVEVVVKRPNNPGLSADWTPVPAGANFQNVDDIDSDGDTTVNRADGLAVGASDLHQMEDLLPVEDVLAVQSLIALRKTEEGTATVGRLVHDAGVTTVGTPFAAPTTYTYLHTIEPTLPDGATWSRARWDAIQYGYRRLA